MTRTTVKHVRTIVGVLVAVVSLSPGHLGGGVHATNMESVIDSVTPDPGGAVRVDVVGGDAFVRVRSDGAEVEIPGYEGEPYLKIGADGSVHENVNSVTKQLNSSRYGTTSSQYTASDVVKWKRISTNGTAMWHDHRAHWMSTMKPRVIDGRGTIQKFEIPIVVNSVDTVITGTLYLRDAAPGTWWLAGVAAMVIAIVMMRRRLLNTLVFAMSALSVAVGLVQYFGLPDGARIAPTLAAFGALAVVLSGVGMWWTRHATYSGAMTAGAGVALVICGWLLRDSVTSHYVPGVDHREWVVRIAIASIAAVGAVAVVDGVWKSLMPVTGGSTN